MNSSKINVKCSKYEKSEAIRRNKMYWKNVIAQLDKDKEEVSFLQHLKYYKLTFLMDLTL